MGWRHNIQRKGGVVKLIHVIPSVPYPALMLGDVKLHGMLAMGTLNVPCD
jgi:hypothetical protein